MINIKIKTIVFPYIPHGFSYHRSVHIHMLHVIDINYWLKLTLLMIKNLFENAHHKS